METRRTPAETLDEATSLRLIHEMIEVSRKKLRNDGILFIVWGWILLLNSLIMFVIRKMVMTFWLQKALNYMLAAMALAGLAFTAWYIYRQQKKVQTYIGISLRYVWVSVFGCMVLINLIQFNVLHRIYFELQHPIFMIITAFALVVTGSILRHRLVIAGGVIYALLAYAASFLPLSSQMLIAAVASVAAFIIPGHWLYTKRNS